METQERANDQKQAAKARPGMSCCGPNSNSDPMPDCCSGISGTFDCGSMMRHCMKMCRWFPLVPVILGISLLLLGYYLDASTTRIMWMSAAGLLILLGALGFLMVRLGRKMCS